jgi:hypothetical protein
MFPLMWPPCRYVTGRRVHNRWITGVPRLTVAALLKACPAKVGTGFAQGHARKLQVSRREE